MSIIYYVIGGQYAPCCKGGAATLPEAKQLAADNLEWWDNWRGWHVPAIYLAGDTEPCENILGSQRRPKTYAHPVAIAEYGVDGTIKWRDMPNNDTRRATKTERIGVRLSPELEVQLQAAADAKGCSVSNFIVDAIKKAVEGKL